MAVDACQGLAQNYGIFSLLISKWKWILKNMKHYRRLIFLTNLNISYRDFMNNDSNIFIYFIFYLLRCTADNLF